MIQSSEVPIEFAKEFIAPRLMWSKPDWFGPVAFVLTRELSISIDEFKYDYVRSGIEPIHSGECWAIPAETLPVLLRVAPWHPEAFRLACELGADQLTGEGDVPHELRSFVAGVLKGEIRSPKAVSYDKFGLPTPKTFLRDIAIYDTADAVSAKFGISPTGNYSATEIAIEALNAVGQRLKKAGIDVTISTNIATASAVAARYKVLSYADLNDRVTAVMKDRRKSHK